MVLVPVGSLRCACLLISSCSCCGCDWSNDTQWKPNYLFITWCHVIVDSSLLLLRPRDDIPQMWPFLLVNKISRAVLSHLVLHDKIDLKKTRAAFDTVRSKTERMQLARALFSSLHHQLHVFAMCFDWFSGFPLFFVIGLSDNCWQS